MFYSNHVPTDQLELAIATVCATCEDLEGEAFEYAVLDQCFLSSSTALTPDHYWDSEPEFPSVSHR